MIVKTNYLNGYSNAMVELADMLMKTHRNYVKEYEELPTNFLGGETHSHKVLQKAIDDSHDLIKECLKRSRQADKKIRAELAK